MCTGTGVAASKECRRHELARAISPGDSRTAAPVFSRMHTPALISLVVLAPLVSVHDTTQFNEIYATVVITHQQIQVIQLQHNEMLPPNVKGNKLGTAKS